MDFVVFLDPFVDEVQRRLGVSAFGGYAMPMLSRFRLLTKASDIPFIGD